MPSTSKQIQLKRPRLKKQCMFISVILFIALVYFGDYFEEIKILQLTSDHETKELRDSNSIQMPPDFHTLESSESDKDEIEKVDDEELLEAIEEVIETIEHQVETNVVDGDENGKVDDEELLEAIEEVIENIEHQVETNSEEEKNHSNGDENEKVDDEELLEAIEEVIENIEHQVETNPEEETNVIEDDESDKVDDEELLEAIEEVIENIESGIDESSEKEDKSVVELLHKVLSEKSKVEARLREDYGPWFDIYFSKEGTKEVTEISDISTERLITLLQSKILSAQLTDEKTTFVWTTGGHSAAAGHGNLFSQSYTAILEDTVKDVFASLDIEFIGRNHAMGGFKSGPELSCCMTSIYGKDTDILSWDFGMTDGSRNPQHMILWSHRAALLRDEGLPFLFYMNGPRSEYETLENNGLGVGWNVNKMIDEKIKVLPDFEKISENEINKVPSALKYFRCGDHFETKGTICNEYKWNTTVCENAKFQTSWHPGWKSHMLHGRILGFFVLDLFVQAIERLEKSHSSNENSQVPPGINMHYLSNILVKRKDAKNAFIESPIPEAPYGDKFFDHAIPNDVLYRSESVCHSALQPSMSHPDEFDAISTTNLPEAINKDSTPLYSVIDPSDVQSCKTVLNIDRKDYYLSRFEDPKTSITVPSGKEIGLSDELYLPDRLGLIMLCQPTCPWGKCTQGSIQLSTLSRSSTHIIITVNGQQVHGTRAISEFCYFLEDSSGDVYWGRGDQYDLSIFVSEANSYLQISSIVIF